MLTDTMAFTYNWESPPDVFKHDIDRMVRDAYREGKVLPLPIQIVSGNHFVNMLAMLLSQVSCGECKTCCVSPAKAADPHVALLPPEYERLLPALTAKGTDMALSPEGLPCLPYPCPFVQKKKTAGWCSIYEGRPLVCAIYPYQPSSRDEDGKPNLALASSCPEGRRIAKAIVMNQYHLRRSYRSLGMGEFTKGVFG